jgi:hypothetical protein
MQRGAEITVRVELENSVLTQSSAESEPTHYRAEISRDQIVWYDKGGTSRIDRISGNMSFIPKDGKPWGGRCVKAEGF